jgi:hypothetical protein
LVIVAIALFMLLSTTAVGVVFLISQLPEGLRSDVQRIDPSRLWQDATADDIKRSKKLETPTFTFLYPGNWMCVEQTMFSYGDTKNVVHHLGPLCASYVQISEVPSGRLSQPPRTIANVIGAISPMVRDKTEESMTHWGHMPVEGTHLTGSIGRVQVDCKAFHVLHTGAGNPDLICVDYRVKTDMEDHKAGFDLVERTFELKSTDDLAHAKVLETAVFKCSYPGNWSDVITREGSRVVHCLSPIPAKTNVNGRLPLNFVTICELPKSQGHSETDVPERLREISHETGLSGNSIDRWGNYSVRGQAFALPYRRKKMAAFCVNVPKESPTMIIVSYSKDDSDPKIHPGFQQIERSFKLLSKNAH